MPVAKQDLSQSGPARQWVAALYFITMTITTVSILPPRWVAQTLTIRNGVSA